MEIESSRLRRASALSCSFIAFPTPDAPGSRELASALSALSAEGCSWRVAVVFLPQAARRDAKTQRRKGDARKRRRKLGQWRRMAVPVDR